VLPPSEQAANVRFQDNYEIFDGAEGSLNEGAYGLDAGFGDDELEPYDEEQL
jgi:hypothetical protein